MAKYQIRRALITLSADELGGAQTPPPHRLCPLSFEEELATVMATKADFQKLCADLVVAAPIDAADLLGAREKLKKLFLQLIKLSTTQRVVLDGGSQPTYRPLPPPAGHWTEDYLQFWDGNKTETPWFVDLPRDDPTHRVYPCLRVLIQEVP